MIKNLNFWFDEWSRWRVEAASTVWDLCIYVWSSSVYRMILENQGSNLSKSRLFAACSSGRVKQRTWPPNVVVQRTIALMSFAAVASLYRCSWETLCLSVSPNAFFVPNHSCGYPFAQRLSCKTTRRPFIKYFSGCNYHHRFPPTPYVDRSQELIPLDIHLGQFREQASVPVDEKKENPFDRASLQVSRFPESVSETLSPYIRSIEARQLRDSYVC